jgi:hypothetical protein
MGRTKIEGLREQMQRIIIFPKRRSGRRLEETL